MWPRSVCASSPRMIYFEDHAGRNVGKGRAIGSLLDEIGYGVLFGVRKRLSGIEFVSVSAVTDSTTTWRHLARTKSGRCGRLKRSGDATNPFSDTAACSTRIPGVSLQCSAYFW